MKAHISSVTISLAVALWALAAGPPRARAVQCPGSGAVGKVCIYNPTNGAVSGMTISGSSITNEITCTSATKSSYSYTIPSHQAVAAGDTRCFPVPTDDGVNPSGGLTTGMYVHRIQKGSQNQYQQVPVLYSGNEDTRARMNWTYFPNVVTVNVTGDAGTGSCTSSCTLRQAIARANSLSGGASSPVLIQFTVSPGTMTQTGAALSLAGAGYITIDATDSNGNPWIAGDANAAAAGSQDPFPRLVDLSNIANGQIQFNSDGNTIKGLEIKNTVAAGGRQGRDLIVVAADTQKNRLDTVRINGGNADAGLDCYVGGATQCDSDVHDLIEVLGGVNLADQPGITISKVEGHSAIDKGVKSSGQSDGGYAIVQDSWFHNNYRGGIQGTSNGHAKLLRNVIEESGYRATDKEEVDDAANGMAAQGGTSGTAFSELDLDANISRNNRQHGAAANPSYGKVTSRNDYFCGNRSNGLAGTGSGGNQTLTGTGVAAAYNGLPDSGTAGRGVAAVSWATANFGDQSANPGNNAFSENVNCDFENGKPSSSINAKNNQWRSGSPNLCLASGASVVTSPVQSGPNSAMSIDTSNPVIPSNRILKGQTLRVRGLGFNAIGGNPVSGCVKGVGNLATQDSCCRVKSKGNTCQGTHDPTGSGNCVELEIQAGSVGALQVTSVTPTTIVTEIANDVHACLGEQANEKVWVTKRNSAGTPVPRSGTYCRNADL